MEEKRFECIMESQRLHRVRKEDLLRLEELLTQCFSNDPSYCKLIPDQKTRERLMSGLFEYDPTESFGICEVYSDSSEMNALVVVSDESEPYNPLTYYLAEAWASLKADEYLIREDPSPKILWNFVLGKDYLNSRRTVQLHQESRLHIIYLTVRPIMRHHGLVVMLMDEMTHYADNHKLMISLETHSPHNVPLYEHFGFKVFDMVQKHSSLKQYCLIREVR